MSEILLIGSHLICFLDTSLLRKMDSNLVLNMMHRTDIDTDTTGDTETYTEHNNSQNNGGQGNNEGHGIFFVNANLMTKYLG